MDSMQYLRITNGLRGSNSIEARINPTNGQLCSILFRDTEYMHGGGMFNSHKTPEDREGWKNNSEITMWPIIGPPQDYRLVIGGQSFPMDRHGTARLLPFVVNDQLSSKVLLMQEYKANTPLVNPTYNPNTEEGKLHPPHIWLPFDYNLSKAVQVEINGVRILREASILSDGNYACALGCHPTFKPLGNPDDGVFEYQTGSVSLREVVEISRAKAYILKDTSSVRYTNKGTGRFIEINSKTNSQTGVGHFMIWAPNENTFAIEAITDVPIEGGIRYLHATKAFLKRDSPLQLETVIRIG